MPEQEKAQAKLMIEKCDKVIFDIGTMNKRVDDAIEQLVDLLEANCRTDKNKQGLLVQELGDYKSCIKFDKDALKELTDLDVKHWKDNETAVATRVETVEDELMKMI